MITDINVECGTITIQLSKKVPVQKGGENHFEDTVTFSEPGMAHCDDFFGMCEIPLAADQEIQNRMMSGLGETIFSKSKEELEEIFGQDDKQTSDEEISIDSLTKELSDIIQIVKASGNASSFIKRFNKMLNLDPAVGSISGVKFQGNMMEMQSLNEMMEVACSYYLFFGKGRSTKAASKTESNMRSISAADVKVV